jgi:hypothetical protein
MDALLACVSRLEAAKLSVVDGTKLTDIKKRLATLQAKLASGELSAGAATKLHALCQALAGRQYEAASKQQLALISSDWNDNKLWLPGVKSLIQLAQAHGC